MNNFNFFLGSFEFTLGCGYKGNGEKKNGGKVMLW